MPSDEIIETMAEGLWQGEWARGGSGGKRRVPWSEIAPVDQERWRFLVIAALSAAEAAGWVMVPKEPTEAMCEEGGDVSCGQFYAGSSGARAIYRAMLAAAGEPE